MEWEQMLTGLGGVINTASIVSYEVWAALSVGICWGFAFAVYLFFVCVFWWGGDFKCIGRVLYKVGNGKYACDVYV